MSIIGEGSWRYDFQRDWAVLPRWWNLGEAGLSGPPRTSVQGAVAANGDVYVLCRAAHPVLVFDAGGSFVSSWGEGKFSAFVHGLSIDRQGKIWIADSGLHTVTQHEPDGTLLRTLGTLNAAAPTFYGQPFNMPTGTAFTSDGDVFVSDGYGNRRVHRFAPDGTLKYSWGGHGTGPGQFVLVHFIGADWEDRLYVCDRDNHRIQIFSPAGETLAEWTGFKMPSDLAFGQEVIYVAGGDGLSIWTRERRLIARFDPDVAGEGSLNIHGIWIDADENVYLAQFDRAVSKLTKVNG
jgi:hypothetical protein